MGFLLANHRTVARFWWEKQVKCVFVCFVVFYSFVCLFYLFYIIGMIKPKIKLSATWNNWSIFGGASRETSWAAPLKLGFRLQEGHHVGVEPGSGSKYTPIQRHKAVFWQKKKMAPWLEADFFFRIGCFQKIGGPPKWMVKIMENPIKTDDLGVPLFLETPNCFFLRGKSSTRGVPGFWLWACFDFKSVIH